MSAPGGVHVEGPGRGRVVHGGGVIGDEYLPHGPAVLEEGPGGGAGVVRALGTGR